MYIPLLSGVAAEEFSKFKIAATMIKKVDMINRSLISFIGYLINSWIEIIKISDQKKMAFVRKPLYVIFPE